MTQTLTNDSRLKLAELETRSRKLLSESQIRKKMSRYNFHTNWMSNCPSCMSSGSRQLEKLDNNKGDEKRERVGGCVSSVYSRGRRAPSTDEWTEKHLIYDLGLLYCSRGRGQGEFKG